MEAIGKRMADEKRNRRISEYELDAILTEFRGTSRSDAAPKEPLAERSKRLVMKTMDDAFNAEAMEILDDLIDRGEEPLEFSTPATPARQHRAAQPQSAADFSPEPGVRVWTGGPADRAAEKRRPAAGTGSAGSPDGGKLRREQPLSRPSSAEKTDRGAPAFKAGGAEMGRSASVTKDETGRRASTAKPETGRSASTAKDETGRPASAAKTEPGRQASTSKAEAGRPASSAEAEERRQRGASRGGKHADAGIPIDQDTVELIEAELEDEFRNPPVRRRTARKDMPGRAEKLLRAIRDKAVPLLKRLPRNKDGEETETEYASPAAGAAGEAGAEAPSQGKESAGTGKAPSPFLALMSLIALQREQLARSDANPPTRERDDTLPEADPKDAAGYYGGLMVSMKPRGLAAALLALLAVYISFAYDSNLPLAGALGGSLRAAALVLLILEISVVICGLDIFTSGILAIPRRRMGADTLVSVSCVLSMLDAAILAFQNRNGYGLPFCGVSAASMAFAIWGSYYGCRGNRSGFRILSSGKEVYAVNGETGVSDGKIILRKSQEAAAGFVTASEEETPEEYLFSVLTPFLLLASLLLGMLSAFARGQASAVVHCISAVCSGAAVFTCTISYSVPFAVTARKLYRAGAAVAGWAGLRDIGRSGQLILTDEDIFPNGSVEVGTVRILRDASPEKVVSYAGSVLAAGGGALAAAFTDLLRNNDFSLRKVSAFRPHDGGGVSAVIAGETVAVGSSRFMRLMGIRMQDKSFAQNTVYAAINGNLEGIFEVRYEAAGAVRESLKRLLRSGPAPVFSMRDFNLTPTMLQETFDLPNSTLRFPAYTERFAPPASDTEVYRRIDAALVKNNLETLTAVTSYGRRAYFSILACVGVSVLSSIVGMMTMFFRCWARSFTGPADLLTFMLVWMIPAVLAVFWLEQ